MIRNLLGETKPYIDDIKKDFSRSSTGFGRDNVPGHLARFLLKMLIPPFELH